MRKEVLWAAGIGITFGLIIAFGVWRINSAIKPTPQPGQTQTPGPTPSSEFKITLDKPENEDVVTTSSINISGITRPSTTLIISGESEDYITKSKEDGTFSEEINLIAGINQIKLTGFDEGGAPSIEKVLVVYSSSFQIRGSIGSPASSDASDEASIRQKVQEKVEAALNKPKAYIGTVTDIADSTIQIKTAKGEIKQIATSEDETSVVKSSGTTTRNVKVPDIAIGDFIVGMGYINSSSVLSAQRILITDAITESKAEVVLASVNTVTTKDISITRSSDGSDTKIAYDKKTVIYDFASEDQGKIKATDIEKGSSLVYVTLSSGTGVQMARSVFVTQNP